MRYRIGIVGGGQLGRMLTIPAKEMGCSVTVIDPTPNCPASQVGAQQITAPLTDEKAVQKLAKETDFLTFEIEHINTDILERLSKKGARINPSPQTLAKIKDKFLQKTFLKKVDIPTTPFEKVESEKDIKKFVKTFKYPVVLKSRFGGYDGRGNFVIEKEKDIKNGIKILGNKNLYIEQHIDFKKELAIMVARSIKGEIVTYPVVETIHKNNILHYVLAPAPISKKLLGVTKKFATNLMQHLGGAGVFGIEMFLTKDNKILVNEIAPRVHNSGHYTIEACITSQFEQHIRAITGIPLGKTEMIHNAAVMVNILGERTGPVDLKGVEKVLNIPNTYLHIYGKMETKMERKMGHITITGKTINECLQKAKKARSFITL